ncbi:hypothetical protein [Kribbella italica]|uniref:Heme/copper-type cytochrome/quinol oxidase subunit 4 n=1 Tax=Kribbella italica TaxID=1540520 RepID=A0A7W9J8S8_9ACTN|nr:hypothetical protein [Kribbella italica]MBB5837711.1 heme/copper-type cytochrome/quinol oxidase subunit 4 [Kribbella italica]
MHAERTATSAVLTLSVGVAVIGHALAGGAVTGTVLPQLLALAAACWLLGDHLAERQEAAVVVLAAIQLVVHFSLDSAHHMASMHGGAAGSLTMATAHLVVLLVGIGLVDRAHQWISRVRRIVARLVPALPAPIVALPVSHRAPRAETAGPSYWQRQDTANVSRRGPPAGQVLPVPS